MQVKAWLVFWGILGRMGSWVWISALIGAVFLLYEALARGGSWFLLLCSIVAALAAKAFAAAANNRHRRLDYVNQLRLRGFAESEADAAWHTATNGGFNVLLNLQQADTCRLDNQADNDGPRD